MGFLQKADSKESILLYQVIFSENYCCRLLDYSLDESKIRKQDSYIAVASVANNKLGKYMAWNWIRGNWDKLFEE